LGYTARELQTHIANHPNWENVKNTKWHLDHIFPVKAFVEHGITDIKLINCLENLQPLSQRENNQKCDNYNEKDFIEWLRIYEFREYVENNFVYRIDKDRIGDFSNNLRNYWHAPNWGSSGTFSNAEEIPPDWSKITGLFAGELKNVIPYAVPRNVKWIVTWENPKRPTVHFNENDRRRIIAHRPYLSKFSTNTFQKVPSGEFFSGNPGSPAKQDVVRNPLNFIRKWYNIQFVPNIATLAKQLKSQNIQFDAEGL
jgi:hypothetical protein